MIREWVQLEAMAKEEQGLLSVQFRFREQLVRRLVVCFQGLMEFEEAAVCFLKATSLRWAICKVAIYCKHQVRFAAFQDERIPFHPKKYPKNLIPTKSPCLYSDRFHNQQYL